ncbi:MAG: hypothetical protein RL215_2244 [Planctomycetota bacterium]
MRQNPNAVMESYPDTIGRSRSQPRFIMLVLSETVLVLVLVLAVPLWRYLRLAICCLGGC